MTGPLCERIELEGEELKCVDTVRDILLPVRASSLRGAERQLDLSDGKNFTTMEWFLSKYHCSRWFFNVFFYM